MCRHISGSTKKPLIGAQRLLVVFLGTWYFGVLFQPALALAQSPIPLVKEVQGLRAEVARLSGDQARTERDLREIKGKLEETGWKALDFASQVSSAQWTMFGTGLAFIGLIVAVAALGAYQAVLRRMQSNLDAAAARLQENLTNVIRREEARLQAEVSKRAESIKEMMESSRQSVQARTFGLISYAFWEQHDEISGTSVPELDEKCRNLETAIYLSQLALECAHKAGDGGPDGEALLTTLRANRAYYIADLAHLAHNESRLSKRFSEDHRKIALELANIVLPTATKSMAVDGETRWPEWLESSCWVLWNLGEGNQRKNVLQHLRQIYEHKAVTDKTKKWIRKRYFQNGEPAWA